MRRLGLGLVAATAVLLAAAPADASPPTFAAHADYRLPSQQIALAAGDLNADGNADLAVANAFTSTGVSVLLGRQDGTFVSSTETGQAGSFPVAPVVADFNGDGNLDVATANSNGNDVSILLGNGHGALQPQISPTTAADPDALAAGDVNQDGNVDLVVASFTTSVVTVLLGNGKGGFTAFPTSPQTGTAPDAIALRDLDGDGKPDIVTANASAASVSVLYGVGDGRFSAHRDYAVGQRPQGIAAGDLTGDGRPDLVVTNGRDDTISVLRNLGGEAFDQAGATAPTGADPTAVVLGDFNLDGHLDVVTADRNDRAISVLAGVGDGTFKPRGSAPVGGQPISVVTGDFNHDGKPDVATGQSSEATASVLLNTSAPDATPTPASLTFGNLDPGTTSDAKVVTVTSTGALPWHPGAASIGGAAAGEYAIAGNSCTGATLAPDATCQIAIRFAPATLGVRSATLSLASDASSGPTHVELLGTGGGVVVTPPGQPSSPGPGAPPGGGAPKPPAASTATFPSKLTVARAGVRHGRLDLLAHLSTRADGGSVRVSFQARGHTLRFSTKVQHGRLLIARKLATAQRHVTTGIVSLAYPGNREVRATTVRLRAANGKSHLKRTSLSLRAGALTVAGTIARTAHGVVRLELSYDKPGGGVGTWRGKATIHRGTWRLGAKLPAAAASGGYLTTQFTGYAPRHLRGEQIAQQVTSGH